VTPLPNSPAPLPSPQGRGKRGRGERVRGIFKAGAERTGDVIENKGSVCKHGSQGRDVVENEGFYPVKPGTLLKTNRIKGSQRKEGVYFQEFSSPRQHLEFGSLLGGGTQGILWNAGAKGLADINA